MERVEEIDNAIAKDPIDGFRHAVRKFGYDEAQHLYNGTSPSGDAQAAQTEIAN
jgi:hypothetical protein